MATAAGVRAGRAFVELSADSSKLNQALRSAQKRLQSFGRGAAQMGAGIAAAGAAIVGPLMQITSGFVSSGDKLNKMALRTGVAVEALSELEFAAEQTGTGLDTMEKGLAGLSRTFFQAKRGSGAAVDALKEIGLTVKDLDGLKPDEQFNLIADGLTKLSDASMKGAVSQQIFGRAGRQLLPMLSGAKGGIEALRKEARELGRQVSTEDAQSAADLADAWNRIKSVWTAVKTQVGAALAPALTEISGLVLNIIQGSVDWMKENRHLVKMIAAVGAALMAGGAAISAFGGLLIFAGFALGGLITIMGVVGSAIGLILSPLGLITIAVGGAIAAFVKLTSAGEQMANGVSRIFAFAGRQIETFKDVVGGIGDALRAGNLELAFEIAMTGVELVWNEALGALSGAWDGFLPGLVEAFAGAMGTISDIWREMQHAITKGILTLGKLLTDTSSMRAGDPHSGFGDQRGVEELEASIAKRQKLLDQAKASGDGETAARLEAQQNMETERLLDLEAGIVTSTDSFNPYAEALEQFDKDAEAAKAAAKEASEEFWGGIGESARNASKEAEKKAAAARRKLAEKVAQAQVEAERAAVTPAVIAEKMDEA